MHTQRECHEKMKGRDQGDASKSQGSYPVSALVSDFPSPDLGDREFLWLELPSARIQRCFVTGTLAN